MSKREALIGDDEQPDVEAAPPPSDEELSKVRDLAREQWRLIVKGAKLQAELEQVNTELKQNMEVDLPTKMMELGLTTFGLVGGFSINTKEIINGSIKEEVRPQAHEWLEKKGHGGMIKRRIEILFGRDDIAWAKKFMRDCAARKKPLDLKSKEWVEPQTLGAFVREQLKLAKSQGADPEEFAPTQLLGVFKKTIAIVDGPDAPKLPKKKAKA